MKMVILLPESSEERRESEIFFSLVSDELIAVWLSMFKMKEMTSSFTADQIQIVLETSSNFSFCKTFKLPDGLSNYVLRNGKQIT